MSLSLIRGGGGERDEREGKKFFFFFSFLFFFSSFCSLRGWGVGLVAHSIFPKTL